MAPISPEDGPVAVTGVSGFTGGHVVRARGAREKYVGG
jgi:hypothetical protein